MFKMFKTKTLSNILTVFFQQHSGSIAASQENVK